MAEPTPESMHLHIAALERQASLDRDAFGAMTDHRDALDVMLTRLQEAALVDHELIAQLRRDALADHDKIVNLDAALATSRRIGAAIGILMATHKTTEPAAFQLLVRVSQHDNRKLRDVAEDVLLTGTLTSNPR